MTNHENNQMRSSESNLHTKDFLIGALVGGIVGAATALFLTPKSGKDIRYNISHQASSMFDKTNQLRETAVSKGVELAGVAKEKTTSLGQSVSKQSHELMNKVISLKPQAIKGNEGNSDIQRMLEETKKAFDETEQQLNH